MKLKDTPLFLKKYRKAVNENKQKQQFDLETALKNGTAYTLPPKYFVIPHFVHVIFWLSFFIGLVYGGFKFLSYTDTLAETCQTIYGLNSIFFKDIIFIPLYFLYLFMFIKRINKLRTNKQKQPAKKVKPKWFSERIVLQKEITEDKEDFIINHGVIIMSIILSIFTSNIPNVTKDLIYLDIAQANADYQQRCLAKQFPFDD